jgi:hypothetical protein
MSVRGMGMDSQPRVGRRLSVPLLQSDAMNEITLNATATPFWLSRIPHSAFSAGSGAGRVPKLASGMPVLRGACGTLTCRKISPTVFTLILEPNH